MFELTLHPLSGQSVQGSELHYSVFKVLLVFSASLCNKKSLTKISRTSTFIWVIPRDKGRQKNKKKSLPDGRLNEWDTQ